MTIMTLELSNKLYMSETDILTPADPNSTLALRYYGKHFSFINLLGLDLGFIGFVHIPFLLFLFVFSIFLPVLAFFGLLVSGGFGFYSICMSLSL